jgi:hypothetical protein
VLVLLALIAIILGTAALAALTPSPRWPPPHRARYLSEIARRLSPEPEDAEIRLAIELAATAD